MHAPKRTIIDFFMILEYNIKIASNTKNTKGGKI